MARRAYAAEFKREAVKAALQPGVSKAQVAKDPSRPVERRRLGAEPLLFLQSSSLG
jgi:transposase-like protein